MDAPAAPVLDLRPDGLGGRDQKGASGRDGRLRLERGVVAAREGECRLERGAHAFEGLTPQRLELGELPLPGCPLPLELARAVVRLAQDRLGVAARRAA